jgi:hypothetical protein
MMELSDTAFPGIFSDYETIWEGIVKVDPGITEYISSQKSQPNGFKVFTIEDSKYQYQDNAQLDNPMALKDFPNKILLFVTGGEIMEYMSCLAIKCHKWSPGSKGLFKKETSREKKIMEKGFILQPVSDKIITEHLACLACIQFDNESSKSLAIEQQGICIFASGSQTSHITMRDPRKSVTTVIVASDERPMISYVNSKNKVLKLTCNGKGITTEEIFKQEENNYYSPQHHDKQADPISILKMRLAKGEITIDEYLKLQKIIEDEHFDSSSRGI